MTTGQDTHDNQGIPTRHRYDRNEEKDNKRLALRNILNGLFMVIAIIGVCIYSFYDQTIGTIVVLVSMVFKIVECVFRFMK